MRCTVTLFAILVLASGCASSRLPLHPPATLDEVNAVFEGREAMVTVTDGRELASEAFVLSDTRTTFVHRDTGDTLSVATDSLLQVAVLIPTSALARMGRSTGIGAAPGLVVTGVGVGLILRDVIGRGQYFPGLTPLTVTAGGIVLLVAGTASGIVHGVMSDPQRWHVIYTRQPDS